MADFLCLRCVTKPGSRPTKALSRAVDSPAGLLTWTFRGNRQSVTRNDEGPQWTPPGKNQIPRPRELDTMERKHDKEAYRIHRRAVCDLCDRPITHTLSVCVTFGAVVCSLDTFLLIFVVCSTMWSIMTNRCATYIRTKLMHDKNGFLMRTSICVWGKILKAWGFAYCDFSVSKRPTQCIQDLLCFNSYSQNVFKRCLASSSTLYAPPVAGEIWKCSNSVFDMGYT